MNSASLSRAKQVSFAADPFDSNYLAVEMSVADLCCRSATKISRLSTLREASMDFGMLFSR